MNSTSKQYLGVLFAFIIASIGFIGSANAATTTNFATISKFGDTMHNYDLDSSSPVSGNNVDWPITLVYCQNANINKVKNIYWGATLANIKYASLNDGGGWVIDSDRGTKTSNWYSSALGQYVKLHLRVYAPSYDYMNNYQWGNYVIGTSHYDENSVWETWSGYSEYAENDLVAIAQGQGYTVYPDNTYYYNPEPLSGSSHIWQNDGWASRVCVP